MVELGANSAYSKAGLMICTSEPMAPNTAVYYDKNVAQLRVVHTDFGGNEDLSASLDSARLTLFRPGKPT